MNRITRIVLPIAAIFCVATLPSPAQEAAKITRIGRYSIAPYGELVLDPKPNGDYDVLLVGVNGKPMLVKSPDYEVTAPRIEFSLVGKKLKPTRMVTTGGTKVVSRNPKGEKTVITCDEMRYSATPAPTDRGIMRLTGGVKMVTFDPRFAEPVAIDGESATAVFRADGTIKVTMNAGANGGTASGAVYEKAKP